MIRFYDLVDRKRALFHRVAMVAQQVDNAIPGNSLQDSAIGSWGNHFSVDHEKDIHRAHLLDVFEVHSIEPHHLVKAFFLGDPCRQHGCCIIACRLGFSHAPANGADILRFRHQPYRLGIIGPNRRSNNEKPVGFRRADANKSIGCKHRRADIHRAALIGRNPVGIQADKRMQRIQEQVLRKRRHAEAFGREIQPAGMHFRTEKHRLPFGSLRSLHAFEQRLPVVNRHRSRMQAEISKRNNPRIFPGAVLVICHKHVVGKEFPKRQVLKIYLPNAGLGDARNLNIIFLFHDRSF